jgi:hypothetical protein
MVPERRAAVAGVSQGIVVAGFGENTTLHCVPPKARALVALTGVKR